MFTLCLYESYDYIYFKKWYFSSSNSFFAFYFSVIIY